MGEDEDSRFPGVEASGQPVGKSWGGDDFKREQADVGDYAACPAPQKDTNGWPNSANCLNAYLADIPGAHHGANAYRG